jgi:hypothetical protein
VISHDRETARYSEPPSDVRDWVKVSRLEGLLLCRPVVGPKYSSSRHYPAVRQGKPRHRNMLLTPRGAIARRNPSTTVEVRIPYFCGATGLAGASGVFMSSTILQLPSACLAYTVRYLPDSRRILLDVGSVMVIV